MPTAKQKLGMVRIDGLSARDAKAGRDQYRLHSPAYQAANMQNRSLIGVEKWTYFADCGSDWLEAPILTWKGWQPRTPAPAPWPDKTPTLRDYQERAFLSMRKHLNGIMVAPAGSGKTVIGVKLLQSLGVFSVVIVPTVDILQQWLERAVEHTGEVWGCVYGGVYDPSDTCMVMTFQSALKHPDILERAGAILIDEAHRVSCPTIRDIMAATPAKYRYGCTATPWRADGLHKAFPWLMGPVRCTVDRGEVGQHVINPEVGYLPTGAKYMQDDYGRLQNAIAADDIRTALVAYSTARLVNHGHKVIVLANRVEHLHDLAECIPQASRVITGGTSKKLRAAWLEDIRQGVANVLLATYSLASEGLDIPSLSCLVMAAPIGNPKTLEQACGRIARPYEGKREPLVVDFLDNGGIPGALHRKRQKVYKQLGYHVKEPKNRRGDNG